MACLIELHNAEVWWDFRRKACGVVLTEDPLIFICGSSLSVHGSAVIGPRLFRLLVVKPVIGARGGL
jgi:hypothetical protein